MWLCYFFLYLSNQIHSIFHVVLPFIYQPFSMTLTTFTSLSRHPFFSLLYFLRYLSHCISFLFLYASCSLRSRASYSVCSRDPQWIHSLLYPPTSANALRHQTHLLCSSSNWIDISPSSSVVISLLHASASFPSPPHCLVALPTSGPA